MTLQIAGIIVFAALQSASPSLLVLRSGETIAISGEPRRAGDRLVFTTVAGVLYSLPASEVDEDASARANAGVDPIAASPRTRSLERSADKLPRRLQGDESTRRKLLSDLARRPPGSVAAPAATAEASPRPAEPAAGKAAADAAAEATWRNRAREVEGRVADAENRIRALVEREQALNDEVLTLLALGHPQEHLGLQVRALQDTKSMIEQAKGELQRAERARTEFHDDARKQGILPGWLR